MTRHARNDSPGQWHHVMNRGIARRTIFESILDIRAFLSWLARAVRAGLIEVHSFCLMTTHFHMLVRSPEGQLSEAMRLIQNGFSREFNRGRRRDGPLYKGRFRSKCASSLTYRKHLVRYIDANPVSAGLVATPALYPHGSARFYAQRHGPIWLSRDWVEERVLLAADRLEYDPLDYPLAFGSPLNPRLMRLIERRIALSNDAEDPLDELLGAARPAMIEWMRRKAALADGTDVGMPVCDADDVDGAVAAARAFEGDWTVAGTRRPTDAWPILHVALLRDLSAVTLQEIGARTGATGAGAWNRYARHRSLMAQGGEYAARAARLAREALRCCHGDEARVES